MDRPPILVQRQTGHLRRLGLGITQLLLAGSGTARLTCQHITVGAPNLYNDCVYPGGVFKRR